MPARGTIKRWLFHITAAASLFLLVAVILLWVRSHWVAENITVSWRDAPGVNPHVGKVLILGSYRDGVSIRQNRMVLTDDRDIARYLMQGTRSVKYTRQGWVNVDKPWWWFLAPVFQPPSVLPTSRPPQKLFTTWNVRVPYWAVAIPLAIAPLLWVKHWRRRRRIATGLCPTCGYDVRATPERCPECGTVAPAGAQAAA